MVPKTERFELRFDPSTLERIDVWREEQPDLPSRAEAVRELVDHGLRSRSKGEFVLNNQEKLIVWLLTEVLKNTKGYENQDTLRLIQEAIYGGHFWAMQWTLTGILHDHVDSRAALSLVLDVLDMYSFIEDSFEKFSPADKARVTAEVPWASEGKFPGFDGNNETTYMSIAQFLVEEMNRFTEFKGRSLNSHHPTLSRYRAMVLVFEEIRPSLVGRRLSVEQAIRLLQIRG